MLKMRFQDGATLVMEMGDLRAAVNASRIHLTTYYPERRYFTAASRSNR